MVNHPELLQWDHHIDALEQERRISIANALELRLSCTNSSTCSKYRIWETFWSLLDLNHIPVDKHDGTQCYWGTHKLYKIFPMKVSSTRTLVIIHFWRTHFTKFKQIDMSTTHLRLKSLSGTSIHPIMVTQRSWMLNSHPFRSISISPPIPEIRLFLWPLTL